MLKAPTPRIFSMAAMLFVTFCLAGNSGARPMINGCVGNVSKGQEIVIKGSAFGTKTPAAPILWETFDGGKAGTDLSTDSKWPAYSGTGKYSSTEPYGGNGLCVHSEAGFKTNNFFFNPTDEVYYSYMSRYTGTGAGPRVYKNGRILSNKNKYHAPDGSGSVLISDGYFFYNNGNKSVYPEGRSFSGVINSSNWIRHQLYGKLSSPAGSANGLAWCQVHSENKTYPNIVTRAAGTSFQFTDIILGLMMANVEPGDVHNMYVDDVYVDNTQARVEIGDQRLWTACVKRDIQIPQSWSANGITVKVNTGVFKNGERAYLFVVDDQGMASVGFPVTVGGSVSSAICVVPTRTLVRSGFGPNQFPVFDVLGRDCSSARISAMRSSGVRFECGSAIATKGRCW